ncbi:MAG: glycosyltransferase [Chitinophagaceae bacterium]
MKLKQFVPSGSHQSTTFFSIIIPARNEADNIGNCLQSIIEQKYPTHLFEIIVIDDHSTDNTSNTVVKYQQTSKNISLIKLQDELDGKKLNAYKKKAIEMAISRANGDWIITTDADCILPNQWLQLFDEYIEKNKSLLVAAPVRFSKTNTVLSNFQYIDFMALQAATAATVSVGLHSMCNGANLAYHKNTFLEVGGFKGIDNIASGDDMLLMNKIKTKYPNRIGYLFSKNAVATTSPMPTWSSFLNQRIRWASKADKYDDKSLLPVLLGIYLLNVFLFLLLFVGFFYWKLLFIDLLLITIKCFAEWYFLKPATGFFGRVSFAQFFALQPLHIAYMVLAGWLGKFGNYQWKGRSVK